MNVYHISQLIKHCWDVIIYLQVAGFLLAYPLVTAGRCIVRRAVIMKILNENSYITKWNSHTQLSR